MEVFKPVVGYEGLYTVSNYGRIFSLQKSKILRPKSNGRGYLQVMLTKDKKHKMLYVHRIVAEAFLQNAASLKEVNHKDENVQNNHADNLEWCSQDYNLRYGTRIERIVRHFKKKLLHRLIWMAMLSELLIALPMRKGCADTTIPTYRTVATVNSQRLTATNGGSYKKEV